MPRASLQETGQYIGPFRSVFTKESSIIPLKHWASFSEEQTPLKIEVV
jgi:hypothetical protein